MSIPRTVNVDGHPFQLGGTTVKTGEKAPDFAATGLDLKPKKLSDFAGKTIVLCSVPSLDTEVCSTETRRFNQIAAGLGDDVVVLTVSVDLPFAQRRWCGAAGIDRVIVMSDHIKVDFGTKFGVLISDLRSLARAVFVINKKGEITYQQLVPDIAMEPDYDAVINAVKALR